MTRWAVGRMFDQLANLADLTMRSLPLLLLFATVLFINAEIWQVASDFEAPYLLISVGMLAAAGVSFLVLSQRRELEAAAHFDSWDDARACTQHSPVADVAPEELTGTPDPPPLTRRGRVNMRLVLVFSQGLQIVLVAAAIGLFYVAFGLFAVREATMTAWVGEDLDVVAVWTLFGNEVVLTWNLARVAILIAALSALQLTFSALTDQSYREEFFAGMFAEMREALAVRAVYLKVLVTT
jgi:hypothetical protein